MEIEAAAGAPWLVPRRIRESARTCSLDDWSYGRPWCGVFPRRSGYLALPEQVSANEPGDAPDSAASPERCLVDGSTVRNRCLDTSDIADAPDLPCIT